MLHKSELHCCSTYEHVIDSCSTLRNVDLSLIDIDNQENYSFINLRTITGLTNFYQEFTA